ncbi:MAG: OB-fold domain-containing protein [Dehalococcoidia bacterium]
MASEFNATAFYNKLKDERMLVGVKCQSCGHLSPEPRPMCPECHGFDMEWHPFSGKAKLNTFTCISIVPVAMAAKGYGRDNPYCTGIVTLEEGPRISARITGVDGANPQSIKTGMDVVLDLEDLDEESPSLAFKPA